MRGRDALGLALPSAGRYAPAASPLPTAAALAWLRRARPNGALPWPPNRSVLCECRAEGWASLSADVLVAALYHPQVDSCWHLTEAGAAMVAAQPELPL